MFWRVLMWTGRYTAYIWHKMHNALQVQLMFVPAKARLLILVESTWLYLCSTFYVLPPTLPSPHSLPLAVLPVNPTMQVQLMFVPTIHQGKAGNPGGVQPTICTVVPFTVSCHIYYTKHHAFLDYPLPIPPIGSGASQSSSKLSYWPLSEHWRGHITNPLN